MIKIGRKHTHGFVSSLIIGWPGPAPYEILWGGEGRGGSGPLVPILHCIANYWTRFHYLHIHTSMIDQSRLMEMSTCESERLAIESAKERARSYAYR